MNLDTTMTDSNATDFDISDLTKVLEEIELAQAWDDRNDVATNVPDLKTSTHCVVPTESVVMPPSLDEDATRDMTQQFWARNRRMREARVKAESAALMEQLRKSLSKTGLANINRSDSVWPQNYREADKHVQSTSNLSAA